MNNIIDKKSSEDSIKFKYGFYLWMGAALLSVVPALIVKEDLRRLNMKDVSKSLYVEDSALLSKNPEEQVKFI